MSLNALRSDYNPKRYKQREELYQAMKAYRDDSFLFDSYRLSFGQFDHYDEETYNQYVNAQQIYDEFVKIDSDLKKETIYNHDRMLEIMDKLLGTRYKAFHRIYKKQYHIKPISKNRYLGKAQKDLENVLYKYNVDAPFDKWKSRGEDIVRQAMATMVHYYETTGRFDLAKEIWGIPITKPKTFTQLTKVWRQFHASKMAKACKITKKEANKQLQGVIKKIKSDF